VLPDAAVPEEVAALQGHHAMGALCFPGRETNRTVVLILDPLQLLLHRAKFAPHLVQFLVEKVPLVGEVTDLRA